MEGEEPLAPCPGYCLIAVPPVDDPIDHRRTAVNGRAAGVGPEKIARCGVKGGLSPSRLPLEQQDNIKLLRSWCSRLPWGLR